MALYYLVPMSQNSQKMVHNIYERVHLVSYVQPILVWCTTFWAALLFRHFEEFPKLFSVCTSLNWCPPNEKFHFFCQWFIADSRICFFLFLRNILLELFSVVFVSTFHISMLIQKVDTNPFLAAVSAELFFQQKSSNKINKEKFKLDIWISYNRKC